MTNENSTEARSEKHGEAAEIFLLDMIMPNGKALRDKTGADLARAGAFFEALAARLAPEESETSAGMKDVIERAIEESNCELEPKEHDPFTMGDYVYHLASGADTFDREAVDRINGAVKEAIFDSLNVDDPWPGLTCEELRRLVGEGRRDQARERGLGIVNDDASGRGIGYDGDSWASVVNTDSPALPLTLREKICATYNRPWLLDELSRKKAEQRIKRRQRTEARAR